MSFKSIATAAVLATAIISCKQSTEPSTGAREGFLSKYFMKRIAGVSVGYREVRTSRDSNGVIEYSYANLQHISVVNPAVVLHGGRTGEQLVGTDDSTGKASSLYFGASDSDLVEYFGLGDSVGSRILQLPLTVGATFRSVDTLSKPDIRIDSI